MGRVAGTPDNNNMNNDCYDNVCVSTKPQDLRDPNAPASALSSKQKCTGGCCLEYDWYEKMYSCAGQCGLWFCSSCGFDSGTFCIECKNFSCFHCWEAMSANACPFCGDSADEACSQCSVDDTQDETEREIATSERVTSEHDASKRQKT